MLVKDTEELAGRIFAQIINGWIASGKAISGDGRAEAELAISYARAFEHAVREARVK